MLSLETAAPCFLNLNRVVKFM